MGDCKKCRKYKAGDECFLFCKEIKLTITSFNNPNELLKDRWYEMFVAIENPVYTWQVKIRQVF